MEWFNAKLAREPMNWAIVWVAASIALLAFHTVMQGVGAMKGAPSIGAPPGMVAAPADGNLTPRAATYNEGGNLNYFYGAAPNWWVAPGEAKWAEDGFTSDY